MIRQTISCDICGTEKRLTNHWFVACEQGGELRVSGFNSRNRLRPGSKHLCGQTCLHKLMDDFISRTQSGQTAAATEESEGSKPATATDTSLLSKSAFASSDAFAEEDASIEEESYARLIPTPPAPAVPQRLPGKPAIELATLPARRDTSEAAELLDEPPKYGTRNWNEAAWERERKRVSQTGEHRAVPATRRRSIA